MPFDQNGMEDFLEYCLIQRLKISSVVYPRYTERSGLGLYTEEPIKKGERIIYAPLGALLTAESVPSSFLPDQSLRQELTTHGLLASWLAFGKRKRLTTKYGLWMNVWPEWHVFRDSLPVLWDAEALMPPIQQNDITKEHFGQHRKLSPEYYEDRKTSKEAHSKSLPAAEHIWFSENTAAITLLQEQRDKIQIILALLHKFQASLGFDILSPTAGDKLIKFLHMWCCVNTRCFYYVLPGKKPPADPNEAMVLVPFLDLFNHSTAGEGLIIHRDKNGFTAIADRDYCEGEELFIEYSQGSNDVLWLEYGFNLDNNVHDELNLDHIILRNLSEELKEFLQDAGYLGTWTVSKHEIGYRAQTIAWLLSGALNRHQWTEKNNGLYDPEDDENPEKYTAMRLQMYRQLVEWLIAARKGFEDRLQYLARIEENPAEQSKVFVNSDRLFNGSDSEHKKHVARAANTRFNMCVMRLRQSCQICTSAIERIETECPDATRKAGYERTETEDLNNSN